MVTICNRCLETERPILAYSLSSWAANSRQKSLRQAAAAAAAAAGGVRPGKCGHTNFKQVMRGGQKRIQRKAKHKWGKKEASEKNGIWTIQCVFASFHVTASHVYLPLGLSLEFKLWNWILQTSMLKKPFIREKAPSKTNDVCWLVCWQLLFVCTLCSLRWWKDTWPWPNHWL